MNFTTYLFIAYIFPIILTETCCHASGFDRKLKRNGHWCISILIRIPFIYALIKIGQIVNPYLENFIWYLLIFVYACILMMGIVYPFYDAAK